MDSSHQTNGRVRELKSLIIQNIEFLHHINHGCFPKIAKMRDRRQRSETVNPFGRAFDRVHSSTAGQFEHGAGKFGENFIPDAAGWYADYYNSCTCNTTEPDTDS
jgi:hypothetical protein